MASCSHATPRPDRWASGSSLGRLRGVAWWRRRARRRRHLRLRAASGPGRRRRRVPDRRGSARRRIRFRPGRDRLDGTVDVDEAYWGGEEEGVIGRLTHEKATILVAAEHDGKGIGRIRMRRVDNLAKTTLHGFIGQSIDPGSTVCTDGLRAYLGMKSYIHNRQVQRHAPQGKHLLHRVHRVISLLKRWLLGTHQGAIGNEHLDYYLDEFTFRFNRRTSASRGKLFYRLAQQAVQIEPTTYQQLIRPQDVGGG